MSDDYHDLIRKTALELERMAVLIGMLRDIGKSGEARQLAIEYIAIKNELRKLMEEHDGKISEKDRKPN